MERFEVGLFAIVVAFVLIAFRLPIGIALGLVSFGGIWIMTNLNVAFGLLRSIPFQFIANWSFSAIPMFLLMGFLASRAGLSSGLFQLMRSLLYRVPGGLACSAVGATAFFSAASGSSLATAAAMGKIAIPEMRKAGYAYGLASGTVAASGTLGAMIPPSVLMIIYGIFTETPVSKLFIAGFVPGLLTALSYMGLIILWAMLRPGDAPKTQERPAPGALASSLRQSWPLPMLIFGVIGGIYTGIVTPTEAGAVGAFLAAMIAAARRSLTAAVVLDALRDTAIGTTAIFIIAMGASMFTTFMGLAGLPGEVANWFLSFSSDPLFLILAAAALYLFLGMFIDSLGIMLLTIPLLLPLLNVADVNLIWFGILVVKLLEIGLITPPFGMNVFVIKSILGSAASLGTIYRGVIWFVLLELLILAALIAFPSITLLLPSLMN